MKKIFIHIGMHKSATSWLQRKVFPLLDVNYIHSKQLIDILERPILDNKINLISYERFSGSHNPFYRLERRNELLNKLSKMFPNAKILLCIRNKDKWLSSAHKQWTLSSWAYDFETYKELYDERLLDYDILISQLNDLFPQGVYVWRFEDFKKKPKKILQGILSFIGHHDISDKIDYNPVNVGIKYRVLLFFYILDNYIFKSKRLHLLVAYVFKSLRK
jgi:hypothetical protein